MAPEDLSAPDGWLTTSYPPQTVDDITERLAGLIQLRDHDKSVASALGRRHPRYRAYRALADAHAAGIEAITMMIRRFVGVDDLAAVVRAAHARASERPPLPIADFLADEEE